MSESLLDTGDVETGSVEPTIDSESATDSYAVEVAEELAGELVETEATDIRVVGQTIKIRSDTDNPHELWEVHTRAFGVLYEWDYRAVDPDTNNNEWGSVFRLMA